LALWRGAKKGHQVAPLRKGIAFFFVSSLIACDLFRSWQYTHIRPCPRHYGSSFGHRRVVASGRVSQLVLLIVGPGVLKNKNRQSPHHHQTHVSAIPHLPLKSVIPNPVAIHPKIPLIGRKSSLHLKLDCKQKQVAFWGHT